MYQGFTLLKKRSQFIRPKMVKKSLFSKVFALSGMTDSGISP